MERFLSEAEYDANEELDDLNTAQGKTISGLTADTIKLGNSIKRCVKRTKKHTLRKKGVLKGV